MDLCAAKFVGKKINRNKNLKYKELSHTCTFDGVEFVFFWNPLSIPKSAKKLEDFGGATCPVTWKPPETLSVLKTFSTYSNREGKIDACVVLELARGATTGAGSSGFWS